MHPPGFTGTMGDVLKAKGFIALEIGAGKIWLSELHHGVVVRSASRPLEPDDPSSPPRDALIAAALKKALVELRPSTRRAVLALDGRSVFTKTLKLPALDADKWSRALGHEAGLHIPFPLEEVIWDAHIINPSASEPNALLVAARKELVRGVVHAAAANGLRVERVTASPVALANAALAKKACDGALLIAARGDSMDLVYVDPTRVHLRSFPAPMEGDSLEDEVARTLSFLSDNGRRVPRLPADDPDLGVPAGLALGGPLDIDLSPMATRRYRTARRRRPAWTAGAIVGMVCLAVGIVAARGSANRTRGRTERVARMIDELGAREREMILIERDIARLEHSAANLVAAMDHRVFWRDALVEVGRLMPEGMFLLGSETMLEEGVVVGVRLEVLGYLDKEVGGVDAVRALRDALRASGRFGARTRVRSRPSRGAFTRRFTLDAFFEEVP